MLQNLDLSRVLVHDIETVPAAKNFHDLSPVMQELWAGKSELLQKNLPEEKRLSPQDTYPKMAGIYAEFGKICCVSVGIFARDKISGELHLRVKSFYGKDERRLLLQFRELLQRHYSNPKNDYICGHNIKEFDVPFICRRMLINGIALPPALDLSGKKPWETRHLIDTMTMWKFGDYKAYTSLRLLCGVFGIPTPKDDIDGSQVGKVYWQTEDLPRIETYCKKDVVATAQLLLKYKLQPLLSEEQVHLL